MYATFFIMDKISFLHYMKTLYSFSYDIQNFFRVSLKCWLHFAKMSLWKCLAEPQWLNKTINCLKNKATHVLYMCSHVELNIPPDTYFILYIGQMQ